METGRGGEELLNKVVILVFFVHKKHSRTCHMDYFVDVLGTFLDLVCGRTPAVYGGSESSQI